LYCSNEKRKRTAAAGAKDADTESSSDSDSAATKPAAKKQKTAESGKSAYGRLCISNV